MDSVISIEEAKYRLKSCNMELQTEECELWESCGRVLTEDVLAQLSVPPFDKSAFDGYALRSGDTAQASPDAPAKLEIIDEIAAGGFRKEEIPAGCAVKILTGAAVPGGVDAVIKFEDTETDGAVLRLNRFVPAANIIPAGEDVEKGQVIARKGTVINGAVQSMLASQGIWKVKVYKKPKIGLISTGSELCGPGEALVPGKIYSSSEYLLSSYLRMAGASADHCGIVPDDCHMLKNRIQKELEHHDMVILTGGASVGAYDYSKAAVEALGAVFLFQKIGFKPGGTMFAALVGKKLIMGLSGNPGASAIGLLLIGMTYVKRLCGYCQTDGEIIKVHLKEPLCKKSVHTRILRGKMEFADDKVWFHMNPSQGNGSMYSLMDCDLLGIIPEGSDELMAGTVIEAQRICF